ncbi:IS30 family transposase [Domibacillus robiginosus]|uniref:IS30 family transposase n=1 Tax=Domibacillus robiginosus TaxID=1071054 RepID=UPI00067D7FE6|nr:IS30 family transposase [Domibacillus robiginosus]
MSYQHLSTFERARIETLKESGCSLRDIARRIGRSVSTVSRELTRNSSSNGLYKPEAAQHRYEQRRKNCGCRGKWSSTLAEIIEEKLDATWSPEQIANRLFKGAVCFKTIYRWLYIGRLSRKAAVLRHKGKCQKPQETRGRFNIGTSIAERPAEVKKRQSFGHWELDTVVSGRGKSKGCVATFVERKTRWYVAVKMTDRSADSMETTIRDLYSRMPKQVFKTATTDRGKEFSCYAVLEKDIGIAFYFADPYSPWQRGSNENTNGLFREFFPKGTDFNKVTDDELGRALQLLNNRPRKCLGWRTPHEAFIAEVLRLI